MASQFIVDVSVSNRPTAGATFPSAATELTYQKTSSAPEVVTFTRELSAAVGESLLPTSMTKVYNLVVRVSGGSITLALTSPGGSAAVIPCDSVFVLGTGTSWLTGVAVSGTANIEVMIAGE